MLVYDFILTFADEINLIWRHKPTLVSAMFVMNRVAVSLFVVNVVLNDFDNVRHTGRVYHHHLTTSLGVSPRNP